MPKRNKNRQRRSHKRSSNNSAPRRSALRSAVSGLVIKTSAVHGRGLFTTKPIRKRAFVIEYTGRRILWSGVPEESEDPRTYYFGLDDERKVIDPTVGGNEARWINHSCDPNCRAIEDNRGRVFIEALRDIRAGEELFYDYRLTIDVPRTKVIEEESKCFCGSSRCRGTMLEVAEQ